MHSDLQNHVALPNPEYHPPLESLALPLLDQSHSLLCGAVVWVCEYFDPFPNHLVTTLSRLVQKMGAVVRMLDVLVQNRLLLILIWLQVLRIADLHQRFGFHSLLAPDHY
jgi:hypothetical protein